jgi:hypothetical protein
MPGIGSDDAERLDGGREQDAAFDAAEGTAGQLFPAVSRSPQELREGADRPLVRFFWRVLDLVDYWLTQFIHWAARLHAGQLVFGWRCLPSVCRSHHSLPLLVTAASGYWLPKNVDHLLSF